MMKTSNTENLKEPGRLFARIVYDTDHFDKRSRILKYCPVSKILCNVIDKLDNLFDKNWMQKMEFGDFE